jgi:hypothetical protein
MRRVLMNVREVAARLNNVGYDFGDRDGIWTPPPVDTAAKIARIELDAGTLPLSVRALFEVVGAVNLIGKHPELCPEVGDLYSDPLETSPIDYAISELETWKEDRATYGDAEAGPFGVPISADDYHKADVSGGPEYRILVGEPSMDGRLIHERHGILFIDYLRLSFAWGGFPGFDRLEARPPMALIEELRRGLLEI